MSTTSTESADLKRYNELMQQKLKPHPEKVTVDSTVHQVFPEKGVEEAEEDEPMLKEVWSDIVRKISGCGNAGELLG